jgi:hypothetical protein
VTLSVLFTGDHEVVPTDVPAAERPEHLGIASVPRKVRGNHHA